MCQILNDVQVEVEKAISKHASFTTPHHGSSALREEFEELWDHVKDDTGTSDEARKEAIQVAAMAVRYILDLIDGER